ncbi:hypothetical protein EAI_07644 [Harpegnathos saltator]|uniref:Uncharacterized protein n=1 Tax=Harpegnathos saltator TaxID=610380 RepID=E2B4P4_HARSA|nr:hypothetical protein EAI_07644 [Harpegnathos saltator]
MLLQLIINLDLLEDISKTGAENFAFYFFLFWPRFALSATLCDASSRRRSLSANRGSERKFKRRSLLVQLDPICTRTLRELCEEKTEEDIFSLALEKKKKTAKYRAQWEYNLGKLMFFIGSEKWSLTSIRSNRMDASRYRVSPG